MKNFFWAQNIAFSFILSAVLAQGVGAQSLRPETFSVRLISKFDTGVFVQVRDPQTLKPMALSWFMCNPAKDGLFQRSFSSSADLIEPSFTKDFGAWFLEGSSPESQSSCLAWVDSMAAQLGSSDLLLTLDWVLNLGVFRTAILPSGSPQTPTEELALEGPQQDALFDQAVAGLGSSYKTTQPAHRNHLLYQGHKTNYVYIYLHGLFKDDIQFTVESFRSFHEGHNVVVGVLPGHERNPAKILKYYKPNDWIDYSHKIVRLARTLGDKVIVVGQSTSGLLGFFLASENQVDGAILVQPSFGLSKEAVVASTFLGDLLTPLVRVADGQVKHMSPEGGRMVEDLLRQTMTCLYDSKSDCSQMYKINVPTVIYVDPHDLTVSSPATFRMVQQMNTSLIEVKRHHKGHMYIPDLRGDLKIPVETATTAARGH
jgi:esterase/lipase